MNTLKKAGFITGSVALTIAMAPGTALAADCGSPAQDAVYKSVHHDAETEQVVDTPAHTVPGEHHPAVTHVELKYGIYTPGETTTEWVREEQEPTEGYTPTGEQRTVTDQEAYDDPDTTHTEKKWVQKNDNGDIINFDWFPEGEKPLGWYATANTRVVTVEGEHHPAVTHTEYEYSHTADGTTETGWYREGDQPDGWTLPIEGEPETRTVTDKEAWTEDDVIVPATHKLVIVKAAFNEKVLVKEAIPAGEECVAPPIAGDETPQAPAEGQTVGVSGPVGDDTPQTPAVVQTDGFASPGGDNTAGLALGGLLLAGAGAGVVVVARRRQDQS